jgi:hypothetical protein
MQIGKSNPFPRDCAEPVRKRSVPRGLDLAVFPTPVADKNGNFVCLEKLNDAPDFGFASDSNRSDVPAHRGKIAAVFRKKLRASAAAAVPARTPFLGATSEASRSKSVLNHERISSIEIDSSREMVQTLWFHGRTQAKYAGTDVI